MTDTEGLDTEGLRRDLAYVKQVAERREADQRTPLGIALVWAVFSLVGFTWVDFDPARAGWFMMLAWPLAYGLAWFIGSRAGWKIGELDRRSRRRSALHWSSLALAGTAVMVMAFSGRLNEQAIGQVILIVVGLTYFLAGVHSSTRIFLGLGLIMIVGAAGLTWIHQWGWTGLGVLLSGGLIASSFIGGPRNE